MPTLSVLALATTPARAMPAASSPSIVGLHVEHAASVFDAATLAPVAVTGPEGVDL